MKRIILITLLATTACAPDYRAVAPDVAVLARSPSCPFEKLGLVRASSGRTGGEQRANQLGAGGVDLWGEQANVDQAYAALRAAAEERGATAVVLRRRERSLDRGSSAIRGNEGLTLVGLAIRTSSPVDSSACAAERLQ